MSGRPVERTEITDSRADICVIDIAINVVGAAGFGMHPPGENIGRAANGSEFTRLKKLQGICGDKPLAGQGVVENPLDPLETGVHGLETYQ